MFQWNYRAANGLQKKKKFGREEDKKLSELVAIYGEDWNKIIQFLPGRTVRQVMERWKYYLDPSINNEPWTPDEDRRLIESQLELGNKWTKMLGFFKNRTANQLKNRWLGIARKGQLKYTQQPPVKAIVSPQEIPQVTISQEQKLPSIASFTLPNSAPIEVPLELFKSPQKQSVNTLNINTLLISNPVTTIRKPIAKIPSINDFLN